MGAKRGDYRPHPYLCAKSHPPVVAVLLASQANLRSSTASAVSHASPSRTSAGECVLVRGTCSLVHAIPSAPLINPARGLTGWRSSSGGDPGFSDGAAFTPRNP
jgi:hypothetical protein